MMGALVLGPFGCVVVSTSRTERDAGGSDGSHEIDSGNHAVGAEATRALLGSVSERVIFSTIRSFEDAAAELERRTQTSATSNSSADREAAQQAWRAAIGIWQELELMQIGPAGMTGTLGGLDLRDEIHSWPLTNACRIDQEVVSGDYEDRAMFKMEAVNVRGLDALEYLLFAEGTENACAPSATINASGAWRAIVDAGTLAQRRAAYAHTLAVLVHERATELEHAWDPTGGDWVGQLARAGMSGSMYSSAQEALNAISDAFFYLDKELKDMKIAGPAAISDVCMAASCPERLESQWAGASRDHMIANLRGAQRIFLGDRPGTDAPGFDDLLIAVGAREMAERTANAFSNAIATAEALPLIDSSSLMAELDGLRNLHTAVRAITDLLKTEFVTVLDLELPERAQGDND
jgi:predicted lipoprotein